MKTYITAHPIDVDLQNRLKIYDTSIVQTRRIGTVLTRLAKKGYTNIHVNVEPDKDKMTIHCNKG